MRASEEVPHHRAGWGSMAQRRRRHDSTKPPIFQLRGPKDNCMSVLFLRHKGANDLSLDSHKLLQRCCQVNSKDSRSKQNKRHSKQNEMRVLKERAVRAKVSPKIETSDARHQSDELCKLSYFLCKEKVSRKQGVRRSQQSFFFHLMHFQEDTGFFFNSFAL